MNIIHRNSGLLIAQMNVYDSYSARHAYSLLEQEDADLVEVTKLDDYLGPTNDKITYALSEEAGVAAAITNPELLGVYVINHEKITKYRKEDLLTYCVNAMHLFIGSRRNELMLANTNRIDI